MKIFRLNRDTDISGTSGTGKAIAYGVVLNSGRAVLTWRTELSSIAIYDNMEALEAIHGHSGATTIEYLELPKRSLKLLEAFVKGEVDQESSKGKKR